MLISGYRSFWKLDDFQLIAFNKSQGGPDHFTTYINIESLCCTTETNVISYINYISLKKAVVTNS